MCLGTPARPFDGAAHRSFVRYPYLSGSVSFVVCWRDAREAEVRCGEVRDGARRAQWWCWCFGVEMMVHCAREMRVHVHTFTRFGKFVLYFI